MEDYDFGITQKNINSLENSYTMLKEIFIERLFTEQYNYNLIKIYFNHIKNIINNK